MADQLADPGPRHPAEVEQRDSAVPEVVWREARDAGGRARSRQRRPEALARDVLEHVAVGVAVVARAEIEPSGEQERRRSNPAGAAGLARGDAPARSRVVFSAVFVFRVGGAIVLSGLRRAVKSSGSSPVSCR
jgi:hypothetical protein